MFHSFFHFLRFALAVVEDLCIADLLDRLRDLHAGNALHLIDQSELVGILFLSENLYGLAVDAMIVFVVSPVFVLYCS